jgi:hypothetical protein
VCQNGSRAMTILVRTGIGVHHSQTLLPTVDSLTAGHAAGNTRRTTKGSELAFAALRLYFPDYFNRLSYIS